MEEASSSSSGRAIIYCRSRKMKNGANSIGRITAQTVSSNPIKRSVSTFGTMVTWKGSSISITIMKNSVSRPRNLNLLSPKAMAGITNACPSRIAAA